jgi:hypothetical protein
VRGVESSLTRSQLLSSSARGSAALLLGATAIGALAGSAQAAPPPAALGNLAAGDLAYARLLIGVELLAIDLYTNAVASRHLRAGTLGDARLALINEKEHYTFLAYVLTAAAQTPLRAADVNFSYPSGSYYSAGSVVGLAVTLEAISLGSYLGAAGNLSNPVLASAVAQITANEAQHLSAFSLRGRQPAFHDAFPTALTIAEASDALDAYTS